MEKALGLDHYFFFDNMARVNEDTDWVDTTFRPDIKRQHFSQDAYFYRDRVNRLKPNSRAPSDYQKKIQNALEIANEIWNKKPPCWRDHFYRSTLKSKIEGTEPDTKYRELTGYHLYVSKQMEALRNLDGNYYNPVCFCIQPRDWVGWRLNTYGRFILHNDVGLHYLYDETKKLLKFENCDYTGRDPFRSAGFLYDYSHVSGSMESNFTLKRIIHPFNRDIDFYDIKDLVMWFPLYLTGKDQVRGDGVAFWDCCRWKINQVNICDCDRDGEPINCIDGVYLPKEYKETQCFKDYFGFSMKYNSKGVVIQLSGTDRPPFYDVYWRDTKVGTFGVGYGGFKSVSAGEGGQVPIPAQSEYMHMNEYLDPCPLGVQDCHKPSGNIHTLGKLYEEIEAPCYDLGGGLRLKYWFGGGSSMRADRTLQSPEIFIKTTEPVLDDRAGDVFNKYGGVKIWYIMADESLVPFSPLAADIEFQPGLTDYCINNQYANLDFVGIYLMVYTNLLMRSCCRTFVEKVNILERPG